MLAGLVYEIISILSLYKNVNFFNSSLFLPRIDFIYGLR